MRVGMNPLRHSKIKPPARVVVLVITHLPDLEDGYHKTRFGVLKRSLASLINNIKLSPNEYDIMIWDNASCDEVREWLQRWVCNRFLSRNIGKINALKSVMRMLLPDTILAYGDDDIEYFPNWLQPQLDILTTYPNVGMVTGWPVRITSKWGEGSTLAWGREHAQSETGRF